MTISESLVVREVYRNFGVELFSNDLAGTWGKPEDIVGVVADAVEDKFTGATRTINGVSGAYVDLNELLDYMRGNSW